MATLSNKIRKYLDSEVDFINDVILQDDGQGAYIKEWNLDIAQPTDEQLNAVEAEADKIERNNLVISTRKKLYGSWESQLEEIYDNGIESWKARILQIKLDNPKE